MNVLVAALPRPRVSTSQLVHLHLPGWTPSTKPRSGSGPMSMCGTAYIAETRTTWRGETSLRRHVHCTPSEAAAAIAESGWLRWCAACVGRAAEHYGLLEQTARTIIEAALTPADS